MAPAERNPAALVAAAEKLARTATELRFFPLVALLERLAPEAARVGGTGPVSEEAVRFRSDPSLSFSAGDIAKVELKGTRPPRFEVTTTFLALTGSGTPLPFYLAEEVAQEDPDEPLQRDFLDLFHHRLLGLFYRLQAKHRLASEFSADGTDDWSRRILALAGFDTYAGGGCPPSFPAWRLLRLAPILASRSRTPGALKAALEEVLGDEGVGQVRLSEFVGVWAPIDLSERTRLGRNNSALGSSFVLGGRVFDRSGAFEIELGPVSYATYRRLLPGGDLQQAVADTVALVAREPLEHILSVRLREEAVPSLRLGSSGAPTGLGRDTWLGSRVGRETTVRIRM